MPLGFITGAGTFINNQFSNPGAAVRKCLRPLLCRVASRPQCRGCGHPDPLKNEIDGRRPDRIAVETRQSFMLAVNPSGAGTPFSTMKVLPLEVMIAFGVLRKFPNFGDGSRSTPHRDRVIGALGLKVPDAARTRRRGDRITEINPLGMSLPGTLRACQWALRMSAYRGRPEVAEPGSKRRD